MEDIFENIKRIKIFEKILIAFSNNKIVLKDLEKPDEHQTLKFRDDGIIDSHSTKEGARKEYQSQAKINLIDAVKELVTNPEILENGLKEMVNSLKPVNFDEKEYSHLKIVPVKTEEEFRSIAERKNRDVIIPIEKITEFDVNSLLIPWNEAKGKIHGHGMVFDKESPIGFLQEINGSFFYMSLDNIHNSSIAKLIEKMTGQDQIDAQRKEKSL